MGSTRNDDGVFCFVEDISNIRFDHHHLHTDAEEFGITQTLNNHSRDDRPYTPRNVLLDKCISITSRIITHGTG